MSSKKPKLKILIYDIETQPNSAFVWGKYDQTVISFIKERELLSYAYSWLGEKEIRFDSRKGEKTDKRLVRGLRDLLEQADIVVAHNGDQFDNKIVKVRMLAHRMWPLKPITTVDTKKAAKAYFAFNGNSLDDLARFLKLGKKLPHKGFEMWDGCMKDDPAAWADMARYNKHDVRLLKRAYRRLQPWIENHPNVAKLLSPYSKTLGVCPRCTGKNVKKEGFHATAKSVQQKWSCNDCGKWFQTRLPKRGEK